MFADRRFGPVLVYLVVHPEHRRRGVGSQLINWGVKEADRLNLESFIEATDLGKLAYEACGFVYAGTNYMESAKRNASPEWKELEREMQYVLDLNMAFNLRQSTIMS
ncbi:MAG: hypothetical protein Q9168_006010 [Polycauliona sp. 1 TL-2023]